MKVKFTDKRKRIIGECISVLFLFVISICACLSDIGIFKIPDLFILKITNQEDLFFNLFGVQATISSVGIAIIALLSGTNTESVYGICFSRYVSHIKPLLLKHNRLIIINLAITFVNYFVVSYQLFNLTVALFFVSIIISIKLVKDTYVVFLGRKEIKKQIGQYVVDNYDSGLLEDFSLSLNDPEHLKNVSYTKENFELLESIYKKEISNINTEDESKFLKILEEISTESSINILKKTEPQLTLIVLEHLLNVYTIKNENNPEISLQIWNEMIPEYFNSLKNLMGHQLSDSGVFFKFYMQLYHNVKLVANDNRRILNNSLKYYSAWLYNALRNNQHQDSFNMDNFTKRIYDNMISLYRFDEKLNDKKRDILMAEVCIFGKNLVDCGDTRNFKKLYLDTDFYPGEEYKEIFLFIVLIYLYYLICREHLANGDDKKTFAEQIVKDNIESISYFLNGINILKLMSNNLTFIRNLMSTWEILPEGIAKTMIIDAVINDFFVFVALERFYSKDEIKQVIYNISPDDTFSIYTAYFTGDGMRIIDLFSNFQSVFYNKTEDVEFDEKIDLLRSVLYDKYKTEKLKEGIEEQITDEDKLKFSKLMCDEFNNIINKHSALLNSDVEPKGNIIEDGLIYTIIGPSIMFRESSIDRYISRSFQNYLINQFLSTLG